MTKLQIINEITKLKDKLNALILAHNYQRDEVQEIADYTGDSLELSRIAANHPCDVIVFCGVHFMAESASILSPNKTVLLPELLAGCPMADMVSVNTPRKLKTNFAGYSREPEFQFPQDFTLHKIKEMYPGVPVVAYVNTSADVKAMSDICCTSANVLKVIQSIPSDTIISIPDRNLSAWASLHTTKKIISWDGFCHVHDRVTVQDVMKAKSQYPQAIFMAHPECRVEILKLADYVTSTSGMLRFASSSDATEFIVGTELGLIHRLKKENPNKSFYPLRKDMLCPNMKMTTLRSILNCMSNMSNIVKVPEDIRVPAKQALDKMLEIK